MRQQSTAKVLHKASAPRGAHRGVHITSDNGQVDVFDVEISKSMADQVTWFAHGASGAIIEFSSSDGSPFEESTFHVPATGSVSSGPAKPSAVANKYYKYTVKGRTGKNDPGVIIHN
jgi:hypothetical protein